MDGNGRWAENKGLLRIEGHRKGLAAVKTTVRCCLEHTIPMLSLFAFSSENWTRPESEVMFLMELFLEALKDEVKALHEQGVSLRFIGCRQGLSSTLQEKMQEAEGYTAVNNRLILNIVINYGGRWEIVNAAKDLVRDVLAKAISPEMITETSFAQYLSTRGIPDPDLFIRTSGEQRISNFFLWQLAYTELYFSPVYWPDFDAHEFSAALASFQGRERRYGKTSQQLEFDHV